MALMVHVSEISRLFSSGAWYALLKITDDHDDKMLIKPGRYYRCHDPREPRPLPPCSFLTPDGMDPHPCWDHFPQEIADDIAAELDDEVADKTIEAPPVSRDIRTGSKT